MSASKSLAERLERAKALLQSRPGRQFNVESAIVWQLFGMINFWSEVESGVLLPQSKEKLVKAQWLMTEIEDILAREFPEASSEKEAA